MRNPRHSARCARWAGLTLLTATLAWLCAACSGGVATTPSALAAGHLSALPAPHLLPPDGQLRAASGPPAGIHVSWTLVNDPGVQGYFLYRDSQAIPLPPPNETIAPALRVNGGNLIPQPGAGTEVPFDDLFTPTVGTTYHYRVTTVDLNGDESYPSNEITYQVFGQHIANVAPLSGFYGDQLVITGDTFGPHNVATDSVLFPGALGGTVAAPIVDWQPTQIKVNIPVGAKTGPLTVAINGYQVDSAQVITVSNPVITGFTPASVFVGQQLTVNGTNFGATQGASTIKLAGQDLSGQVSAWSNTAIALTIPVGVQAGDMLVHTGTHDSNPAPFSPRAEILDTAPPAAADDNVVALHGRYFGNSAGTVSITGTGSANVVGWSDVSITIHLNGTPGPHSLTVHPAGAPLPGNDYAFTILDPLTVSIAGIASGAVCRAASPPALSIVTAPSAEKVELLLNNTVVATSTSAPFSDLALPLATEHNGAYTLVARATRGVETVLSTPLQIEIVSLTGDVNGDGTVDNIDRDALVLLLGLTSASPTYHAWYDTDEDGLITEADLSQVGYNFGKSV